MGSTFSRFNEAHEATLSNVRLLSSPKTEMTSYENRVSAYLADDPRSPTNADATFDRTPLEIRVEKKSSRVSSDGSFLMFTKTSTPNVAKPPSQSSLDPRSPTIGLARTPVVVVEEQKQSDSLEVITNYTNLQLSWDLDESNTNDVSSEEFNKNLMSSTPKPVKEEQKIEAAIETEAKAPRTPLSKLQHSANSPVNVIIIPTSAEKPKAHKRKQKTPSRNYQKEALANRIRMNNADLVHHDKEN